MLPPEEAVGDEAWRRIVSVSDEGKDVEVEELLKAVGIEVGGEPEGVGGGR